MKWKAAKWRMKIAGYVCNELSDPKEGLYCSLSIRLQYFESKLEKMRFALLVYPKSIFLQPIN
jgi:hypothetical protein